MFVAGKGTPSEGTDPVASIVSKKDGTVNTAALREGSMEHTHAYD